MEQTRRWATADTDGDEPAPERPVASGVGAAIGVASIRMPQSWQNFCPGTVAAPHSGQAAPSGRPHSPQNLPVTGFPEPQAAQTTCTSDLLASNLSKR
jgi:hypothetical protein